MSGRDWTDVGRGKGRCEMHLEVWGREVRGKVRM